MHILVTGGTGFIGSNLCRTLIQQGHQVICLDNNYTGRLENIAPLLQRPDFKFVHHDICDDLTALDCLKPNAVKIDQIYNLACPASPPAYQGKHALDTTRTCVMGAFNVLGLAQQHQATVLQASTSEVYGDPLIHPQREDYWGNVNPNGIRSCYDEGKRCAESIFCDYHRHYGAKIKIIRIFNTYGPFMDPKDGRVISNFICQALQGRDLTIYGQGEQTRSFCYITDLIAGMIAMMNSPDDFIGPVNLGNLGEFTIKELAQLVLEKVASSSQLHYCDLPQDDPKVRRPDITLAQTRLNWQPHVLLNEGLDHTIAYYRERLTQDGLL